MSQKPVRNHRFQTLSLSQHLASFLRSSVIFFCKEISTTPFSSWGDCIIPDVSDRVLYIWYPCSYCNSLETPKLQQLYFTLTEQWLFPMVLTLKDVSIEITMFNLNSRYYHQCFLQLWCPMWSCTVCWMYLSWIFFFNFGWVQRQKRRNKKYWVMMSIYCFKESRRLKIK